MVRSRGRHSTGLLALALDGNWPIAAALAVMTALAGIIMPALLSPSTLWAAIASSFKSVVWLVSGFFALTALVKYRLAQRAESRRRMHEYLEQDEASRLARDALARGAAAQARFAQAHPPQTLAQTCPVSQRAFPLASPIAPKTRPAGAAPTVLAEKPTVWSLELLQAIEWKRFEALCAEFYREKNIPCAITSLGPDGGIDIRLLQDEDGAVGIGVGTDRHTIAIVHCKAWGARLTGVKPVRELLGVMTQEKIPKAFFMTSGSFTDGARVVAKGNHITLLDGKLFLAMIERMPAESSQRLLSFATEGDYATPSCPRCATKMIARENDKRLFWGCVAFPACRQILPMRGGARADHGPAGGS